MERMQSSFCRKRNPPVGEGFAARITSIALFPFACSRLLLFFCPQSNLGAICGVFSRRDGGGVGLSRLC